jgi:hypothetical protein
MEDPEGFQKIEHAWENCRTSSDETDEKKRNNCSGNPVKNFS